MRKKNLIIILLIPFVIALLSLATVNATIAIISSDIINIKWDYEDTEAFELAIKIIF